MAFFGGQGVEWWFNGISRFPTVTSQGRENRKGKGRGREEDAEGYVNGESVEREMVRERWMQGVRMGISGLGFLMGIVGIWGDGV